MNKYSIQNSLYSFPYHYIPHFGSGQTPQIFRLLNWGLDYLTYTTYVIEYLEKIHPTNILDVGCGDGYVLNHLRINGSKTGIDLSGESIMFAKAFELALKSNTNFRIENIFNIESEKYDCIILTEVLEHIPDSIYKQFVNKIIDLLSPNGHLIITVPTKVTPVSKKHYRHYDEEMIDDDFTNSKLDLILSRRLYNQKSKALKFINWLIANKVFLLSNKKLLRAVWRWHKKNTFFASKKDGKHIFRHYQLKSGPNE